MVMREHKWARHYDIEALLDRGSIIPRIRLIWALVSPGLITPRLHYMGYLYKGVSLHQCFTIALNSPYIDLMVDIQTGHFISLCQLLFST